MKITQEEIIHVANLARLELKDNEIEKMQKDMESIIEYVNKLNELETDNVKAMEHVLPISNVLREDESFESFDREEILKNAPSRNEECFKVPKVVE